MLNPDFRDMLSAFLDQGVEFLVVDGVRFADAWHERKAVDIDGLRIPVIGRRHLIANKRAVGRPQDLVDADLLESN